MNFFCTVLFFSNKDSSTLADVLFKAQRLDFTSVKFFQSAQNFLVHSCIKYNQIVLDNV